MIPDFVLGVVVSRQKGEYADVPFNLHIKASSDVLKLLNLFESSLLSRFRIVLLPAAIYLCVDQMLVLPALIRPWLLHICDTSVRAITGSGEHMPLLR